MRLGTKLTIYLFLIIILVLSGYGYLNILFLRDIHTKKMKLEVKSIGQILKISLEKISMQSDMQTVQGLINAVNEHDPTLKAFFYDQGKNLIYHSPSMEGAFDPFLALIKKAINEDRPLEKFGDYKNIPVFLYTFPVKDKKGGTIGGVTILQQTAFVEDDINRAELTILITVFILIGGTLVLVLFVTRKWITQPITLLTEGIENMAKGNLDTQIDFKRGDEISKLAQAFNQMAVHLKKAQDQLSKEGEAKLELERNLRHSEKLATIGQLASELAHEIGTPLNIIAGRADLIKKKPEEKKEVQKNVEIVLHQTERITKIIEQLLSFVRKKKPELQEINIPVLLGATLDFLYHQIKEQKVKVVKEIQDDHISVVGDPDQLQQVFLNLVLNAIHAMPNGGTLRLTASPKWTSKEGLEDSQHHYLEVCVEDTGVGMEEKVVENIFNAFFTTKEKGTGLGLTVTQGIVQNHEGWIDVASEPGKGSVFKVYLPSVQGETKGNG